MRILVAEDDSVSALILQRALEKMGYEVTVVGDGLEAWDLIIREDFRLVISDWMMPNMDGVQLCRRIRSRTDYPYVYLILLTAKGAREDRFEGMEAGADDFLVKPLDATELTARLKVARRILSMQKELQERSEIQERLAEELEQKNTDLSEAVERSQQANHRFAQLFEGLPVACYSCDEEGRIYEWNQAAYELFGYQPHEVIASHIWDIFPEECPEKQQNQVAEKREMIQKVIAGQELMGIEATLRAKDGMPLCVLMNVIPLRTTSEEITGLICANVDITRRKMLENELAHKYEVEKDLNRQLQQKRAELINANERLAEMVTTDGLTGLKNHRYFREELEKTFMRSVREGLPVSIVMLDVDNFKQYNDTFGHPAGDEVLRTIAKLLQRSTRRPDLVARYGGEEFVILLPNTGQSEAQKVAERVRKAIANHPWTLRPVTASLGIATLDHRPSTPSLLVDQADKALYVSKHNGRNRVTHSFDVVADILDRTGYRAA
jgi:two-component system cell cycle response regulator